LILPVLWAIGTEHTASYENGGMKSTGLNYVFGFVKSVGGIYSKSFGIVNIANSEGQEIFSQSQKFVAAKSAVARRKLADYWVTRKTGKNLIFGLNNSEESEIRSGSVRSQGSGVVAA
jgi:hypothetical protein